MAVRPVPFTDGEFYHLYNRGNSKQAIFLDDSDRERFIKLLYLCNSHKKINFRDDIEKRNRDAWDFDRGEQIVCIGAWVLMSNHFHLYITQPKKSQSVISENNVGVSEFMQKVSTAYVKYFNTKYGRTGSLFEGKFKSVHITDDTQAKYLFSYIHLNPLKTIDTQWQTSVVQNIQSTLDHLNTYKWNSYHDYRNNRRNEAKILNREAFPEYFQNEEIFDKEIFDWLSYRDFESPEARLRVK